MIQEKRTFSFILTSCFVNLVLSLDPVILTDQERIDKAQSKISQFRQQIHGKIYPNSSLVHQHIQDNLYIFRWIERSNFDVKHAVHHFLNHLAWRNAERIDKIDLEDWTNYHEEYPQYYDTFDKAGKPVSEIWLSSWDIRRAFLSGQGKRLVRWVVYFLEMTHRRLYATRRLTGNKNITGAVELVDSEGFNVRQHYCGTCFHFFLSTAQAQEKHYPFIFDEMIVVNVGAFFLQISNAIANQLDSKIVKPRIYSTNRRTWTAALDKEIEESQRSERFGGTIIRS